MADLRQVVQRWWMRFRENGHPGYGSTTLNTSTIFTPFGQSFVPVPLLPNPLLELVTSLFEGTDDAPMWCPSTVPTFTGDFPFLRHVQFWLHLHNKYQEVRDLPPPETWNKLVRGLA